METYLIKACVYKAGAVTYFFLTQKVLFSQVGVITKFLNSIIFNFFNLWNILKMLINVLFDDFQLMLLQDLTKSPEILFLIIC